MFKRNLKCSFIVLMFATLPVLAAGDYGNYRGKGGMSAYAIQKNVYEYHYDNGFTGSDAMGWNPNLQFAWSRIAAAQTCGVEFSLDKVLKPLIEKYQQDEMTHSMIGVGFHAAQSKANPDFCTQERVDEIKEMIPKFESSDFPKKF